MGAGPGGAWGVCAAIGANPANSSNTPPTQGRTVFFLECFGKITLINSRRTDPLQNGCTPECLYPPNGCVKSTSRFLNVVYRMGRGRRRSVRAKLWKSGFPLPRGSASCEKRSTRIGVRPAVASTPFSAAGEASAQPRRGMSFYREFARARSRRRGKRCRLPTRRDGNRARRRIMARKQHENQAV